MEKSNVFGLIKMFEQLSDEMSKPKPVELAKQKSIVELIQKQESLPANNTPQRPSSSVRTENVTMSKINTNPLAEIEDQIAKMKEHIVNISKLEQIDEKILFKLFVEMMDLLISLSSIDSDGVKSMKIKKECCLRELKDMQNSLKSLIGIGPEVEAEKVPETVQIEPPNGEKLSFFVSKTHSECSASVPETTSPETSDDNVESEEFNINDRQQSVHSLTRMFESSNKQSSKPLSDGISFSNLAKSLERIETESFVSETETETESVTEEESEEILFTPIKDVDNTVNSMTLGDLMSELEYYKEMIEHLDSDDIVRLESLNEQLSAIAPLAEEYEVAKLCVVYLLDRIEALKGEQFNNVAENSAPTSQVLETQVPHIEITLIEDQPQQEQDVANINHPEETPEPGPEQGKLTIADNAKEMNEDDEHLALSIEKIEFYKDEIRKYLVQKTVVIIEFEDEIENHYNNIRRFEPHEDVAQEYVDVIEGYKELLDLITDAKFKQTFNDTIGNEDDDESNHDVEMFDSISNLQQLATEIGKYPQLIEQLDPQDTVKAEVLQENLLAVTEELTNCGIARNNDLEKRRLDCLNDVNKLQELLRAKCEK